MLTSPASSPNSHWRDDGDLGDRLAVCSAETKEGRGDGALRSRNVWVASSSARGYGNDGWLHLRSIPPSFPVQISCICAVTHCEISLLKVI